MRAPKPSLSETADIVRNTWNALTPQVRFPLLISGTGDAHLIPVVSSLAEVIGSREDLRPVLHPVINDITLHTWELNLFSARFASMTLMLHEQKSFLTPEALVLCKLCKSLKPGDDGLAKRIQHFLQNGENEAAMPLVEKATLAEKGNLFWLHFASYIGFRIGSLDWYERILSGITLPEFLRPTLMADLFFARQDWEGAAAYYEKAYAFTGMTEWLVRRGECLKRMNRRDEALACWVEALTARPWQINLLLRLTELLTDNDKPGSFPTGKGQILLYSWNHGRDLDQTFASLYASDLGDAGIIFLDNGSDDNTPEVAGGWQGRFGSRIHSITLPTNVGAPAARNWLLCTEEAKSADWVIFLDDDALVAPDWLAYLGSASRQHPEADIIGCKVVDQAAPMVLQSVDLHLMPQIDNDRLSGTGKMSIVETHRMTLDFGQFNYVRPASSVTGCCHLLFRKGIEKAGLFDIRFSPSQFDDLERDFRASGLDQSCIYQGNFPVRHMKRTGGSVQMSPWQSANVEGNLKKLMLSYPAEKLGDIIKRDIITQERLLKRAVNALVNEA